MNKEIEEFFKDIPEIIVSPINMAEPNQPISIYEGDFRLKQGKAEYVINGVIKFEWFPHSSAKFSGIIKTSSFDIIKAFQSNEKFELILDNLNFGNCFISNYSISSNVELEGTLIENAIKGDKTIPISKIIFAIPNLKYFRGLPVKQTSSKGITAHRSRLIFESEDYVITIDKCVDFEAKNKFLSAKGGYILLYEGELIKKKGNLTFDNSKDLLLCFSTFLSFLNGRRVSPLFRQGIFKDKEIWTDYTGYFVDQYKSVYSWPQSHSIDGLDELWQNFSSKWKNEDDKYFFKSVIHWYIESNSHSGFTEGSIIMAQTGLELIYNWLLIENKNLLIGKDAENISASNKIRLLLSQLNVSNEIPKSFTNLQSLQDIVDAPDAFVQIRNAIVHSQEEKRKKLSKMPSRIKYEA